MHSLLRPLVNPRPAPRMRAPARPSLGLRLACLGLLAATLAACAPTKGTNTAFVPDETTNQDFVTPPEYVTVGNKPVTFAFTTTAGGVLDRVAVANQLSNDITVLQNDGSGNLSLLQTLTGVDSPAVVLWGDFNADTLPDLAVLHGSLTGLNKVTVFFDDGSGNLGAPAETDLSSTAEKMALATLDDSSRDMLVLTVPVTSEIVVVSASGGVLEQATIDTGSVSSAPGRFTVGDFNGDGYSDMAVLHPYDNLVTVWLGDGAGSLAPASAPKYGVEDNPVDILATDVTGDGLTDLAVSSTVNNLLTTYVGRGDGTFDGGVIHGSGTNPGQILSGEFHPPQSGEDLLIINSGLNYVSFLRNNGNAAISGIYVYTTRNPFDAALGDFDRNGLLDFVLAERDHRELGVYTNEGGATKTTFKRTVVAFDSLPTFPRRVNLDGTNPESLLALQPNEDRLVVLRNAR